jgi:hypothetical protein
MITWEWERKNVPPGEILESARHLSGERQRRTEVELISNWVSSSEYLRWSSDCLSRNDDCGRDAAVCYAKRAACRQIDTWMVYNHLSKFAGQNYAQKIQMLGEVGLGIPDIVRELVINPRNDVEHGYTVCTQQQAKQAFELCKLFLTATSDEAQRKSPISIGWRVSFSRKQSVAPGNEYDEIRFWLEPHQSPMLIIDTVPPKHNVILLYPGDEELQVAPLDKFSRNESIELARLLRSDNPPDAGDWSVLEPKLVARLSHDLKLQE